MASVVAAWPTVALGEVLQPISRPVRVEPTQVYPLLGMHWYAEGLYIKDRKPGTQIQADTVYEVREGDFVYNRLFAWKGSFGVAGPDVAGCYVSNEFPSFRVDEVRLIPRFLHFYFSQSGVWDEAQGSSSGSTPTSRLRLKEPQFLAMQVPLPPLDEQRRIVARIEALAERIAQARGLRREAANECDALCRSFLFGEMTEPPVLTPMRSLTRLREADVVVDPHAMYQFAGVYSFGRGVFEGGRKQGAEFAYGRLTRLRAGDFVYPKLMAWEGALGVVPETCDGLVVSPEFPVFEIDQTRALPEVLDIYFRTPAIWPLLSGASTGTNVRRRRLHPSQFLALTFPLPAMSIQQQIRTVKARVDAVKHLQMETDAELDALLPAVLDQAFREVL